MDKRQEKTVSAIKRAFYTLIKENSYAQITVKDIAVTAKVGRSTFYEHFQTKQELLYRVCDDIFPRAFFDTQNKSKSNEITYKSIIANIFFNFSKEKQQLKNLIYSDAKQIFCERLNFYLTKLVNEYMLDNIKPVDMPLELVKKSLIATLFAVIFWLLNTDSNPTLEKLTGYYYELISHIFKV